MEGFNDEEIVISGMSGVNPASEHVKKFMENLYKGVDMTTTDHNKWKTEDCPQVSNRLGVVSKLEKCDVPLFGINRKTANSLDPITRRFLEHSLEAIIDAGISPAELKGSMTSVIFTASVVETEMNLTQGIDQDMYAIMGRTRCLNANRVSYWLDLKGPSYSLESGWNGGLQGVEDAVQSLKTGLADAVILGSGNSIFNYHPSYQYNKLNLLSADGVTRSFDIEGSGYGRAEAVDVIVLQRSSDARRSYGSIVHVKNATMGDQNDLIYKPIQNNWLSMLEEFYTECKVNPSDVSYLEAYGSADINFDAAELNAVGELFCPERSADNPLYIGSVKSNMGHAEAAASLASLIKLAIMSNFGKIPPNLHFSRPNPAIRELVHGNMKVVTETTPLEGDYLALNSFTTGGMYGHLLLKRNPKTKNKAATADTEFPQLVTIAARTDDGILSVFDSIEQEPYDPEYYNLINRAFDQGVTGYMYRGFTVLPTTGQKIRDCQNYSGEKRPIWFVFTGMGCQWATMGRDLMALPVFRKSIEISHNLLKSKGLDLKAIITIDDPAIFDNIIHCFVGITSIQIALIDLLKSIGVTPDGIIGHSVGETAASYCDGCSTHEQTLLTVYHRGKVSQEGNIISGRMAAVGLGYQAMKDRVPEGIEIACHNAADSCTLSGPSEHVEKYVAQLQQQGVFARTVNAGNIPYHSKHIQHLGPKMVASLNYLYPSPKRRSSKWISSSVLEEKWQEDSCQIICGKYHANNLMSPVYFEEAAKHIPEKAILLEIGPHGLLQAILRRSHPKCINISTCNRTTKNQQYSFLQAVGRLYVSGVMVNIAALYPPVTYPVSRETALTSHLGTWDHSENWKIFSDVASRTSSQRRYDLKTEFPGDFLITYKLDGVPVVPHSAYLVLVWKTFTEAQDLQQSTTPVEFKDILFHKDVIVNDTEDITLSVHVLIVSGNFDVVNKDGDVHVSGVIRLANQQTGLCAAADGSEMGQELQSVEFYKGLTHVGHKFDEEMQPILNVIMGKKVWGVQIEHRYNWTLHLMAFLQLRIMLASTKSPINKVQKLRKIFHLVINPEVSEDIVEASLDLETDTFSSGNIEMRDVHFRTESFKPITFTKEELNRPVGNLPPSKISSTKIAYVHFHGKNMERSQVSFSGTSQTKGKVMGLGVAEDESLAVKKDPVLRWKIPAKWTLEQAVSVPLNFLMAYNAIHIFGDLKPGRTAVITESLNNLGLACLRVALEMTLDVHAVVKTDEEKRLLQKLLPQLPPSNVIINKGKTSEQLCLFIRKSFPQGVDLFVNTGAPDNVKNALHCVSSFGKIVEMSEEMFKERGKFENTSTFLKSASFYTCGGTSVINSHDSNKTILKQLFDEGLAKGVVVPLNEEGVRDYDDAQTIRIENKSNAIEKFICEPEKAYLILGGDPSSWLSIAEWFISRKAKHVFVVHEKTILNRSQENKLKHLQGKTNLIVKPADKLSSELIKHIFEVSRAKIALTMLLPMKSSPEIDDDVLVALCKQDIFLVSVTNKPSKCTELSTRSKPTLTIVWNEPLNGRTGSFLQSFDRLLTMELNNVVQVSSEGVIVKEDKTELGNFLPTSVEEVLRYGADLPVHSTVTLTALQTKSLSHNKVREIVPLFIIPGITSRSALAEKFKNSIHPVFLIDYPLLESPTLQDFASLTAPKLWAITSGPFSILGEGWGGAVAMETARVMESMGGRTQVFLLSAIPEDLTKYQWTTEAEADEAILSRLFDYNRNIKNLPSWRERLLSCIPAIQPVEKRITIENALNSIREKIHSLKEGNQKISIEGEVHCITRMRIRRQTLDWMSKRKVTVSTVTQNKSLLGEEIFNYIHDNIVIKKLVN